MTQHFTRACTLAAALLFAGCGTESLYVQEVQEPSRVNLLEYSPVAIDDFRGDGGIDVAEELTVALTSHPAARAGAGAPVVEVVDRRYLERAIQELGRSRGDEWDPSTIVRLGKLVGARCLVHGRVSEHECTQEITEDSWQDSKGRWHKRYTLRAVARVTGYLQASEVETGKILVADKIRSSEEATSVATDRTPDSIDCNALLRQTRRNVVDDFMRSIAPHTVTRKLRLYVDGDLPKLLQGNAYARLGEWSEARRLYEESLHGLAPELKEYRYKPLYNLAVAQGRLGEIDEALRNLKEAYSYERDGMILQELEHLRARRAP